MYEANQATIKSPYAGPESEMAQFVDPRTHPQPSGRSAGPGLAPSPEDLESLHRLCGEGRLYEVEAWIMAGQPLQLAPEGRQQGRRLPTALEIALETGQHSLLLLLLCNGYRLDLEPVCPLTRALEARRWEYVDLFWAWGADPRRVTADTVFDTYNSALFDRFHAAGVDFLAHHALAEALGNHTSNKPLFGWARRHREHDPRIQVELNMALRRHADQGNLKGVHLCLWAGADAHAPARDLPARYRRRAAGSEDDVEDEEEGWTAIQEAVAGGHVELLPVLKPDPAREDFEDLYVWAPDARTVQALADISPPRKAGSAVAHHLLFLDARWLHPADQYRLSALEVLFKMGARWTETTAEEMKCIRHRLRDVNDASFTAILKLLAQGDYCSPAVLQELGRVPRIRQRMAAVGLVPGVGGPKDRWTGEPYRVPRAREVATKLGIPIPKPVLPPPRQIEVGRWRHQGEVIRLTRQALYERVWAEPVDSLAEAWGLSGRGLAKVCQRMGVPVPPRGYWAKVQHGKPQRRLPLKDTPGGDPAEIVIRIPPKTP
jgi:hypothetical protein